MSDPLVFDIQRFSLHDGPGIRTIVFFKGCPLRCQWCANPESQEFEPELLIYPNKCIGCGNCVTACEFGCFNKNNNQVMFDRIKCVQCCRCTEVCYAEARRQSGKRMTVEDIIKEVDKDEVFYRNSGGGITFSGGEPMCFPETVYELAKYYKVKGISTAVETCGYVEWESYEKVLPYMDLVMFDLKIIDNKKHIKYTGVSNKIILDNILKVSSKVNTVVRIPIIPIINDSKEDIDDFGMFISKMKDNIDTIHILPYHDLGISKYHALGRKYMLEHLKTPSDEHIEGIKAQLATYGFRVIIGG